MSYDLMVFETTAAPRNRKDFMEWFTVQTEWSKDDEYDNPDTTSDNLKNWFMEIIKTFPPKNGIYALSEKELNEIKDKSYITNYSIGKHVIYAAFAWSIEEEALETVTSLAKKYNVGFFDVSSNEGEIVFPDGLMI